MIETLARPGIPEIDDAPVRQHAEAVPNPQPVERLESDAQTFRASGSGRRGEKRRPRHGRLLRVGDGNLTRWAFRSNEGVVDSGSRNLITGKCRRQDDKLLYF
jgi:hypothetical protein